MLIVHAIVLKVPVKISSGILSTLASSLNGEGFVGHLGCVWTDKFYLTGDFGMKGFVFLVL